MHRRVLASLVLAGSLAACGGSRSRPAAVAAGPAAPIELRDDQLLRSDVIATLSAGPGAFLGKLEVEPKLVAGKFAGWRILAMRDQEAWSKVDLAPGDVVTSINGYPLERPEQALVPWRALAIAPELKVAYEREGQPRELHWEIVDEGAPASTAAPAAKTAAPAAPAAPTAAAPAAAAPAAPAPPAAP